MKTCAYCGSSVQSIDDNYSCSFCSMTLNDQDVKENGKRKDLLPNSLPVLSDLNKSTLELMRISIIELLTLLKLARRERADIYKQRYVLIQAIKEGATEFSETEAYAFSEYEKITRKCFVLENIIRERMGYFPSKLTESYIQNLAARIEESAQKDMVIQQPKPLNKQEIKD
jgi:hypothetical protein